MSAWVAARVGRVEGEVEWEYTVLALSLILSAHTGSGTLFEHPRFSHPW